ncbi:uncharacterized protein LOC132192724 [Neocloeon triangulifer]|uniref:uncharacterized protein LOC132192724 n=1 Tax=Neocloeon triangulifer TaxID=2078957 RepID=UPI00286ECEC9|nr:uncharacterized protein LOC132192724 [Neocloeon triangulifer]
MLGLDCYRGAVFFSASLMVYYVYSIYNYGYQMILNTHLLSVMIFGLILEVFCLVGVIFQYFLYMGAKMNDPNNVTRWLYFSKFANIPYFCFVSVAFAVHFQWIALVREVLCFIFLLLGIFSMNSYLPKMTHNPDTNV